MDSISQTLTRHMIYLQKYGASEVLNNLPLLRSMLRRIKAEIKTSSPYTVGKLRLLEKEIKLLISTYTSSTLEQLRKLNEEFLKYEASFTSKFLDEFVTLQTEGIAFEKLQAAITKSRMNLVSGQNLQSFTIQEAVENFDATLKKEILGTVRFGATTGRTLNEMTRDVNNLVTTRSKRQSEALIRTTVNHIGNETKQQFYKENSDVIEKEKYVATLDKRTTITCAANDGKFFQIGEGPMPPLHWNCRSIRVPVIKKKYRIPGVKRQRASYEGPVNGNLTYSGFLRKQPKEFQNDVLGVKRANLFRQGKLNLDEMTDKYGRVITLNDLKKKENLTF